ncbi:MAG: DNA repair protein RecO [Candidatus Zambryskibacteria bacterium RIFCSPLOWO2_02_FULL_51_21]|uniref:DNA repair protein RecO n=1 Tax=Candidatus Zambryskibacteria bacterium RIFCSPHIGHO2_02_FULL_43_37 TaxID=1802749 RepID=A0A1G2TGX9_9BACT|nr:MAG: DNA repair protein RecO [Candidatus Zambryskibacteria bacterium RIFCSPHIGHO2_01_FULL_52_18]OHA96298.1 MAG: DNA repair protein RecO [Candidatus Zambryskibacteria bacterium RIFCSPHIGHO2_02_FULL_43_37]OHB07702.1 MAG: DNA repair protein RecO [Candidatus Zambryskibacteria bacterium RIFCSPLOWO2_01_FULL_52_12]OHB11443.1 MAG: DNA repair protein RecO [Candidatus Zambryskibacteria bacterium RIFCSPLOWO2_02_FULL_51_21]
MSYHIYTTKGIILSAQAKGEADRLYSILTRDFGLIRAHAIGVRKSASKLRGALEPVSLSSVSLVRGKEYWRLTSAEVIKRFKKSKPLFLLEQLVAGEATHPELFDAVEKYLELDETTLVAQILFHLGYLKKSDLNLPEKELIKAINAGLEASML